MLYIVLIILAFTVVVLLNKNKIIKKEELYIPQETEEYSKIAVLINRERLNKNLHLLKAEKVLNQICEDRCDELIELNEEVTHDGFDLRYDESKAVVLLEIAGYGMTTENSYFQAYLKSKKGHKEIMLANNVTHIGTCTKGNYNVCLFAKY